MRLSGGERQPIALVRAFLADARIIVFDEATASLDNVTEREIEQAMHRLMEGRTTLTIAHRLSTVRAMDRILVFEEGKIVEQGTHDSLMGAPDGPYQRLVAARAGIVVADGVVADGAAEEGVGRYRPAPPA